MDYFEVFLSSQRVGMLTRKGAATSFSFFDEYLDNPDRKVLGLAFEENLRRESTGFHMLPVWFRNLLPEGQLRQLLETSIGIDPGHDPLSREVELLETVGEDLPGAVRIARSGPEILDDVSRAVAGPTSQNRDVAGISTDALRFSAAGIGLKFSTERVQDQFVAPARNATGRWYVKMPDPKLPNLPTVEHLTMALARRVGISVPEFELVNRDQVMALPDAMWHGESLAYAIRRFDRPSSLARTHIEDMAQVRSQVPGKKYFSSFESVAKLFYRGIDEDSLVEFIRRFAFSMAVGNGDAHLKNWSLIYEDGRRPTISPAYDMVSVVFYKGSGIRQDRALTWRGHRQYGPILRRDFLRFEEYLGWTGPSLEAIAVDTVQKTTAALKMPRSAFEQDLYGVMDEHARTYLGDFL